MVVVAGHRGEEVQAALEGTGCRIIINPDYHEGMLSSIQAGARELRDRCGAFFVLPVDIPLVRPLTIRRLMDRFREGSALVHHPCFASRRGHPPLMDASLIDELLTWQGEGGLKVFLDEYTHRSVDVPVADAWIRRDVDTVEDLAALRRDFEKYTIPAAEECEVILEHYLKVPEALQAHGRAVARAAANLGDALNTAGEDLDLDLLTAAGLLHDIFKGEKEHAGRAAAWLEENGFPEVAAVVAEHTDIRWEEGDRLDERALVYLADKVLTGTKFCALEERLEAALEKYGHEEAVRRNIHTRFDAAMKIRAAVEKITGMSLFKILGPQRTSF